MDTIKKTKIYTCYTDTHQAIYEDHFLPSFYESGLDQSFELRVEKFTQKSPSGDFNSIGFNDTMFDKLNLIKLAINENPDTPFVFSDCDVVFYKNIHSALSNIGDVDVVFQDDQNTLCTGFFIANPTQKFKEFIDVVYDNNHLYPNEQVTMNMFKDNISYRLLDQNQYFTVGNLFGLYTGGDITLPDNIKREIVMHHANFTVGVANKIKLINKIREQIRA